MLSLLRFARFSVPWPWLSFGLGVLRSLLVANEVVLFRAFCVVRSLVIAGRVVLFMFFVCVTLSFNNAAEASAALLLLFGALSVNMIAAQVLPSRDGTAVSPASDGARDGEVHEGLQLLRGVKLGRPTIQRRSGVVLVLYWCCTCVVLVLCWCCTGVVLVLYWDEACYGGGGAFWARLFCICDGAPFPRVYRDLTRWDNHLRFTAFFTIHLLIGHRIDHGKSFTALCTM